MRKLSTSLTIFLKLVIPLFWLVFFGSISVAIFIYTPEGLNLTRPYFKWFLMGGFLGFIALLYFTVFQLKRVEGDGDGLFISNYFRHIFIPFEAIDTMEETSLGPFLLVRVTFLRPTYFGKSIRFLASKVRFRDFTNLHQDRLKVE